MFTQLSLSRKIALLTTLVVIISATIISFINHQQTRSANQQLADQIGSAVVSQLAANATNPVITNDKLALQTLLQQLVQTSAISYGAIVDATDEVIVEAGNVDTGRLFAYHHAIAVDNGIVGQAHIQLTQSFDARQWTILTIVAIIILAIASFYLTNILLKPIAKRLLIAKGRVEGINNDLDLYPWQDELGELETALRKLMPRAHQSLDEEIPPRAVLVMYIPELEKTTDKQGLMEIGSELKKIIALYGGDAHTLSDSTPVIFQRGKDNNVKALCTGIILREMMMAISDKYPALRSVTVGIDCENSDNTDRSEAWQQHIDTAKELAQLNKGVSLSRLLCSDENISGKISVSDGNEGFRLKSVKKELKDLLEQQLQKLLPAEGEQ